MLSGSQSLHIRGDLVLDSFKLVYNFLIKVDGVTVQNLIRRILELNSPKEYLTLTILYRTAVMVQI